MRKNEIFDYTIIGSGPTACFSALSLSENSNLVSKQSNLKEISFNYPDQLNSKSEFVLNKLKSFSN